MRKRATRGEGDHEQTLRAEEDHPVWHRSL